MRVQDLSGVLTDTTRITAVTVTPVAFHDPPLLNAVGVHEPFALRAVIELATDAGLSGLGETYADSTHLRWLRAVAAEITGADVHATGEMYRRVATVLAGATGSDKHGLGGPMTAGRAVDQVFAPFEVACLDVQGKAAGRPVADLLGGAVRRSVPYSAYLFYKWAAHPGQPADGWGPALDPDGIVAQARTMIDWYGFSAIKLKGGVFPPEQEIEAIRALRAAFPRAAVASRPAGVVLSDLHYWGGLRRCQLMAGICGTFGIGVSMHSNSHLGISLAAMTHLAAATGNLDYACDTHWPWKDEQEDVIVPGALSFRAGAVPLPDGPGLGIELDRDALAVLHEQYLRCGLRDRDDTGYMRRRRQSPSSPW